MSDQTRNLNPTAEAIAAMYLYGADYSRQRGGSMDYWDTLQESEKRVCRDLVNAILQRARLRSHPEGESK